jgi:hypothetical protein
VNVPPELFANHNEDQVFAGIIDVFNSQTEKNALAISLQWPDLVKSFRSWIDEGTWRNPTTARHFDELQVHASSVVNFPDYRKLAGAAWRFVALNYGYPQLQGSSEHRLQYLILTALGKQVCSRKPEDNPSRPGYVERLRRANPKIEEEVFERLIDAAACLDVGLHRPAIVMLGISAEVTTARAYRTMKQLALITKTREVEFRHQIEAVVGELDNLTALVPDQRHRLRVALVAVEGIRVLRNDAAHHGNPAPDPYVAQISSAPRASTSPLSGPS